MVRVEHGMPPESGAKTKGPAERFLSEPAGRWFNRPRDRACACMRLPLTGGGAIHPTLMSADDEDVIQEIAAEFTRISIENYCIIASSVLLFADAITTFTDEVQRIWHRKFTGATVVFLVTRYVAVAERLVLVVSVFLPTLLDKVSRNELASEQRSYVCTLYVCLRQSCAPVLRLDDVLTDISYLMFGSTIYFVIILFVQIFSIVSVIVGNSFVLWDVWPYFDQVFTVIFTCRFMLSLRGVYLSDRSTDTEPAGTSDAYASSPYFSTMRFSSSIVGNMGAPLDTFGTDAKHHSWVTSSEGEGEGDSDELESGAPEMSRDPLLAGLHHPAGIELPEAQGHTIDHHNDA
ncbi:hypothetical protein VTO73DRAFT_10605 [Trametes versicolor]